MNAICLVIDRLHAGFLGPYGNCWVHTPAFDRLAADSFVFDCALIDTPVLEKLYHSYWQGWHGLCRRLPPDERASLPTMARIAGVNSVLFSDDQQVVRHPLAVAFDELVECERAPPAADTLAQKADTLARDIDQTHLARAFAEMISWLARPREPFLLWCHLASLGMVWDAPFSLRQMYREEEDPEPYAGLAVPHHLLPDEYDPDEVLSISQAYAGQVSLLDTCLGALLEFLDESTVGERTLLAVTAARGMPLGEHRRIGAWDDALYGELVHVPLVLRLPDRLGAAGRSAVLVQPADLWATLLAWWRTEDRPTAPDARDLLPLVREDQLQWRDRLAIAGLYDETAIRTPAWYLRVAPAAELYVKPDDRWEVNNVAVRCPEIVEGLSQELNRYRNALDAGQATELPPLEEVFLAGIQ